MGDRSRAEHTYTKIATEPTVRSRSKSPNETRINDGDQEAGIRENQLTPEKKKKLSPPVRFRDGEDKSKLLLAFCACGICGCFLWYGVVQEKIYSYSAADGSKMSSTLFLLLTQTVTNAAASKIAMAVLTFISNRNGPRRGEALISCNWKVIAVTSFLCVWAMAASNEALRFVSYPTQSLGKSCKLVPVMMMGVLVERRSYSLQQYFGAALITVGIIAFNLTEISRTRNEPEKDGKTEDTLYGMFLLLLSLTLDGLVGGFQGVVNASDGTKYRRPSALEMMFLMNAFSTLFIMPMAIFTGQIMDGLMYISDSPDMLRFILMFNVSASCGQFFIFLTITQFSPLVCTTITTSRKFITILLSVFTFGHVLSAVQWVSVITVFTGLFVELCSKRQGVPQ